MYKNWLDKILTLGTLWLLIACALVIMLPWILLGCTQSRMRAKPVIYNWTRGRR